MRERERETDRKSSTRNPKVDDLGLLVARLIVDGPLSCRLEALDGGQW